MEFNEVDLFNNPMIENAKKALTKEDRDFYRDWGKAMFDGIDYETGVVNQMPAMVADAMAYVENSLKSGQHPSTLTEDEKNMLTEIRGKEWYKDWGYVEEDLNDIVTILKY